MQPTPANPICTDYITVALAVSGNVPAASGEPRKRGSGVRRWSPEDGGEGLLRVPLLRPLVPPQGAIKSTHTTWYSSLVKPI